jgi:hypothetical protein
LRLFTAVSNERLITTWNIYKADGKYIGQARAHSAESAFCRHMTLINGVAYIPLTEIRVKEVGPGLREIRHNKKVFIVRAEM